MSSPAASSSSSSDDDDNEPLTVQDIEKWHSHAQASVTTDNTIGTINSADEGDEEKKEGSFSSAAGSPPAPPRAASADNRKSGRAVLSSDELRDNDNGVEYRPPRQLVAGLPWTDGNGNKGMYTGEVNDDNVPDGVGLFRHVGSSADNGNHQQQEGEWKNGKLIQKKGIQHTNNVQLSTITEDEQSVGMANSVGMALSACTQFSDEFLYSFLANKNIASANNNPNIDDSSNSLGANTTGEHSNARDFADSGLYSSTNTFRLASSTNSRNSHIYSSTNSRRPMKTMEFVSSATTAETAATEKQHQQTAATEKQHQQQQNMQQNMQQPKQAVLATISSSYSPGQQQQKQQQEKQQKQADESHTTTYVGSEWECENLGDDEVDTGDYPKEQQRTDNDGEGSEIPLDTIVALRRLVVGENGNDDNENGRRHVQYESDEDDNAHNDDDIANSKMYDWHLGPLGDSDHDDMRPSLDTHLQQRSQQQLQRRGNDEQQARISKFLSFSDELDGNNNSSKSRRKRWCYLFSVCCVLSVVGIALISWAIVRMRTNSSTSNQSKSLPENATIETVKVNLTWAVDTPCAYITIDLVTDQYGNETTWALYLLAEVNNETSTLQTMRVSSTESTTDVSDGHRNRLRSTAFSYSNRKMGESTNESLIISGGPYPHTNTEGSHYTSSVETFSTCLPVGNYKYVISDRNGICCQFGLGKYSIYFNGGRTIHMEALGVFQEQQTTPFEVTYADIFAALVTTSPSQSIIPGTMSNSSGTSRPSKISNSTSWPTSPSVKPTLSLRPSFNSTISFTYLPSDAMNITKSNTTTSFPTSLTNNTEAWPTLPSVTPTSSMRPSFNSTISLTYLPSGAMNTTESNTTTSLPTSLTNNTEANITTTQPSINYLPSSLPSQFLNSSVQASASPTIINYTASAVPSTANSTSSSPTVANLLDDPILDIKLLDSLSVPYILHHIIKEDIETITTSRLLQDEATTGGSFYGFSTAVSADMSVLAVGATNALDESGNHAGAVFLYSIDSSDAAAFPTLAQVLYGSSAESEFGNGVALSDDGNRLVVAARSENVQEGAIRVYERASGTKEWMLIGTIVGEGEGFRAGWSVAISGDGNVVAMGSTKGGSDQGGIVSTYVAPDWILHGSIIEAKTSKDVTGFSVSLNGDGKVIAVGSVKATNPERMSNAGRVDVYAMDGTSWNAEFEVFGDTRQGYDGSSVALSSDGSLLVVGGRGFTSEGSAEVGRCRIFERSGTGQYELLHTTVGKNKGEELGWSVAISADGNKVACGGQGGKMLDLGESGVVRGGSGVVRVWDRVSLQDSEVLPRGERLSTVEGSSFGSSVSLSSDGSSLVVGASTWFVAGDLSSGAVQIFSTGAKSASSLTQSINSSTNNTADTSPQSSESVLSPTIFPTFSFVGTSLTTNNTDSGSKPTISPTRYINDTTSFLDDPILDMELLDTLSSPYTMNHFLQGDDADSLYGFSTAVSADMSVLAVGATNALDESGNHAGAVFLYSIDSSDAAAFPTLAQVLYGSSAESEFGNGVALSDDGNRLVVAARSENVQEGAIRVYERASGTKEWMLSGTIVGEGEGFRAGWSVAISGDGNVVAMGSTKGGSDQGGIVSTYVAPDWILHGSIIEAKTSKDVTGFSVSLNGDGKVIAVGSVKATNPERMSNAGRVDVYAMDGTSWNAEFEVFGDSRQGYDGSSVALSSDGSLLVVGGRGFTSEGSAEVGRCRIFERSGTGQYELLHTTVGKNKGEELGWSVAISADGNKVACGGQGGKMLDLGESGVVRGGSGVVRVWDRVSLQDSEVLPRGERLSTVEGSSFGSSVSLSSDGSSLVVGASTWAGGDASSSGGIFSFSLS